MIYLLDANVLITAYRVHYQFDFCPAFWDWLTKSHHNQKVYSVQRVLAEISDKDDKLRDWIRTLDKNFFLPTSKQTSKYVEEISKFILENDYKASEKKRFLEGADVFLIAHSMENNATVVTYETQVDQKSRKVKLPNVCKEFNVNCILPSDMLQIEKAKFILQSNY